MRWVGVGYRPALSEWILAGSDAIGGLEITAEHFFDDGVERLQALRGRYPIAVHGLGLSLGTPGPLDRDDVARFARVSAAVDAVWVSEHIAFTRTTEIDLGHLNPVIPTEASLGVVVDHARELMDRCGRRLILENISSHVRPQGELTETEFMNRLCERSGCGLLLDVTNLYINSRNHQFDALAWLGELDPAHIVQLHVVGYSHDGERYQDYHARSLQSEIWALTEAVLAYAPVTSVVIERDQAFPPIPEMEDELRRLGVALARH